jgi:peroxiredoxin
MADVRTVLVLGLHRVVQDHPPAVAEQMTQQSERFVRRVSIATSIGLAVMLAATLGYIGWPRVAAAIGVKPAVAPPAYTAGEQADVPAAWYRDADTTLIVFARASCAACEKAQPFLTHLVGRMQGRGAAVMAHPPGADQADRQFARSLGVADDRIVVVTAGLKVRATPTVILVNRQGRILGAWEGVGKETQQATILKTIDATTR